MLKGLILAGGRGTRLRPFTHTRAKQLMPIAGKPNIAYAIQDLLAAGISHIGIIINPQTGADIKSALGNGSAWGAHFEFIEQAQPLGLAHAVSTAKGFLGQDSFVMYLGDNLLSGGIGHVVQSFVQHHLECGLMVAEVDNANDFGVVVLEGDKVVRLIEKPQHPPSRLALVGVYVFSHKVHACIEQLQPSARGEYEITEAIQAMVDRNYAVQAHLVRGWWKDTGKPEDLLHANRLVLDQQTEIYLHPTAQVQHSTIVGPAYIGAHSRIEHAHIGPYVTVGEGAVVQHARIEHSILMQHAKVLNLAAMVQHSILGEHAHLEGRGGHDNHNIQLMLSDGSLVKL